MYNKDQEIVAKLDRAMIPRYTHSATLENSGFAVLADITKKRKYVDSVSKTFRSYYLYPGKKSSARCVVVASALMAKEICLTASKPVCYAALPTFIREIGISALPRETQSLNPVMERVGKGGYIVVPEFTDWTSMSGRYTSREIRDFESILVEHLDMGGALILGGTTLTESDKANFSPSFREAFDTHFTYITVE